MLAILAIVAPVFGILGLGFLSARTGYLEASVGKAVAQFAFKVAMPALLFRAMLSIGPLPGSPWRLVAAYFGGLLAVWALATILTRTVLRRPMTDAASIAMGACFGNTVMLGIPLAITAFGQEAAAPVALLISIDTPLLWIMATLHIEAARKPGLGLSFMALRGVFIDLARNPIVLPLVVGTIWRFTGLGIPAVVDRLLEILAGGAVPAALFSLGASLATYEIKGQTPTLLLIVCLKMLVFPLIAGGLAIWVFDLPPLWTAIVLLFAAMPVGANAYLFASRYERAVASVSAAIAVSTALAIVTLAGVLYLLKQTGG